MFLLARLLTVAVLAVISAASVVPAESEDETLLTDAAASGDLEKVRKIVSTGISVDTRDSEKRTPLLLAVHANNVELATLLIDAGADVNAKDAISDTPFLYAGAEGRDQILKQILKTGRADLKDTNRYGGVALIPAAHHGHPSTVRLLLETEIDVNHVNDLGWTALLEAVILGDGGPVYQEIVGLLVDAGARNLADRDGVTPLDHARTRGYTAIETRIASA